MADYFDVEAILAEEEVCKFYSVCVVSLTGLE